MASIPNVVELVVHALILHHLVDNRLWSNLAHHRAWDEHAIHLARVEFSIDGTQDFFWRCFAPGFCSLTE